MKSLLYLFRRYRLATLLNLPGRAALVPEPLSPTCTRNRLSGYTFY